MDDNDPRGPFPPLPKASELRARATSSANAVVSRKVRDIMRECEKAAAQGYLSTQIEVTQQNFPYAIRDTVLKALTDLGYEARITDGDQHDPETYLIVKW